ncbi:hypothetical protein HYW94_02950 [Candidatus Uhrbacteria bacterium]|nr:hypothetical protein [Candidatus Uhrbacteria bacterium]
MLPTSTNKNYLKQTDEIVAHLQTHVYRAGLPPVFKVAIDEFLSQRPIIEPLIQSNSKKAAEMLANLTITQLTRQSAPEVLSDFLTTFLNTNDERLLENMYTWTATRDSDGRLVDVGSFGAGGASVDGYGPVVTNDILGVLLSRTA